MSTSRSELCCHRHLARFALAFAVGLVLLHSACFDPYSNQLFEEDALFLAAIPDAERVITSTPNEAESRAHAAAMATDGSQYVGGLAVYPLWMVQTSITVNEFIFVLLYLVEAITAEPISEREEDLRRWGPYPTESGHQVVLEMVREGERFDYSMLWNDGVAGDGTSDDLAPFSGSFLAGEVPREGVGEFLFDFELYEQLEPGVLDVTEGLLHVNHDNSDGQVLLDIELVEVLDTTMDEPISARYAFYLAPDGSGWFEFADEYNIEGTEEANLELFEVRNRWQSDGAGRADARISGGDLEPWAFRATECWNSDFLRVHYADDTAFTVDVGDPADCVFPEEELPSHL